MNIYFLTFRRGHSVLRAVLPKKEEHVLLIRMTPIQRQLYKCFVKDLLYVQQATNPLKLFAVCCKVCHLFFIILSREFLLFINCVTMACNAESHKCFFSWRKIWITNSIWLQGCSNWFLLKGCRYKNWFMTGNSEASS